jgi:hypothetical protein
VDCSVAVYYGTYIAIAILVLKIILLIVTLLALYGVAKGIFPKRKKKFKKEKRTEQFAAHCL